MKSSYGICGRRSEGAILTPREIDAARSEPRAQPIRIRFRQSEKIEVRHRRVQSRKVGIHSVGKACQPACGMDQSLRRIDQPSRQVGGKLGRPLQALGRLPQASAGAHLLLRYFDEPVRNAQQLAGSPDRPRRRASLRRDDRAMAGVE